MAEKNFKDLGFGTQIGENTKRLINKDGSFNVIKKGIDWGAINLYQYLITVPWWGFTGVVLISYILINALFAGIYVSFGIEHLSGNPGESFMEQFAHAYFFSAQTITTVGYGAISPTQSDVNLLASFEAMLGLLGFALASSLLYGRFSQPRAKIRFSECALIAPYGDVNSFQFRIINRRRNQLIELEAQVTMMYYEYKRGEVLQRFERLTLERDSVNLFPLTWTIVHPIEPANSPLYGMTQAGMVKKNVEFLILIKAYDDTFAQMVHARFSYKAEDIKWGKKFKRIFHNNEQGDIIVELNGINEIYDTKLNHY